jgi:mono/diheme cytochrome c family protein
MKKTDNSVAWIGGYCFLPLLAVVLAALLLSGCSGVQRDPPIQVWDDMKQQPKFHPQGENDVPALSADHRDARRPPEGTVARGHMTEETSYFTGMDGEMYVGKSPVPLTPALLHQGQMRFNTYCQPCHDKTGSGQGIVPTRIPTWQPSNLTEDRVVQFADGDIFNVITNGRRSMPAYRFQITVADRWAIIAYVRALQRAAHATKSDVPADHAAELQ